MVTNFHHGKKLLEKIFQPKVLMSFIQNLEEIGSDDNKRVFNKKICSSFLPS